ncbi:tRNA (guanine-N(7)-)-methyltransferase [bacterium BMS3Abin03]|nr:tRNA (guanine-N(7)-)-methyltransferase [bacterium BMS3Abin03]
MARTKRKKISEVRLLPNVFSREDGDSEILLREYFANNNSISLEIGCGHGDYTIELAQIYPHRNFVGIDFKGARIYYGAKRVLDLKLPNSAFLLTGAEWLIGIFKKEKIEEIFIPFPDPHYKRKSIPKRLVSPEFLNIYKSVLRNDGRVHLKTDNTDFYRFALKTIEENDWNIIYTSLSLYNENPPEFLHNIKTKYEMHYLKEGRKIKYICFGLE